LLAVDSPAPKVRQITAQGKARERRSPGSSATAQAKA